MQSACVGVAVEAQPHLQTKLVVVLWDGVGSVFGWMVLVGIGGGVAMSVGRSWWWGVLVGSGLAVVVFFWLEKDVWEEKEEKGWG